METNRRKFIRIPMGKMPCKFVVDGQEQTAEVLDESISGVKIGGVRLLKFSAEKIVSISHRQESFEGVCRTLRRGPDNLFELGIERIKEGEPLEPSNAMLLNCYFQHGGFEVVCIPIKFEADQKLRIRLWNGIEFVIPFSQVISRTRAERYRALRSNSKLKKLVELYGLPSVRSMASNPDLIFDFEFGQLENCPTRMHNLV